MASDLDSAKIGPLHGAPDPGFQMITMDNDFGSTRLALSRVLGKDFTDSIPARPRYSVLVLDWISWAAIAAWVAKAVVSALASAAVGAVLDGLSGKKVSLEETMRRAVIDIANQVRAIVAQDALERAYAATRALQFNAEAYGRDPVARSETLLPLTLKAREIVEELKRLRVPATGAYTLAASLEMALLSERVMLTKSKGEWDTFVSAAFEFRREIEILHQELVAQSATRYTSLQEGDVLGHIYFFYTFDGRMHMFPVDKTTKEEAIRGRQEHMDWLVGELTKQIISPAAAVANEWLAVAKAPPAYL